MKKKVLSILLAAAMSVTLLVGLTACGNGNDTPADPPAAEADDTDAGDDAEAADGDDAVIAEGDNVLTVWSWDPAFNLYAIDRAAEVFRQTNPDFEVNNLEVTDIGERIIIATQTGDLDMLPDILLMQDGDFLLNVTVFPEIFTDLTDSGIDFSQFAENKLSFSTVDGRNFGVPFDNGAAVLALRIDILEQAGFTLDDFTNITWRQFIDQGQIVLETTGYHLISEPGGGMDVFTQMMRSAGVSLFDGNDNVTFDTDPHFRLIFEQYIELVQSEVLRWENEWDGYIASFTTGNVAGTMNGCWILASVQLATEQAGNWRITNVPRMEGIPGATNYATQGGSSWVVTSASQNPQLAIDFLGATFAGSTEFYDMILGIGALSTWLPAGDSDAYAQPVEFFGGEPIWAQIVEFAANVPLSYTGLYFWEARDVVATALTNVLTDGADIDAELANARSTLDFLMD